MERLLRRKDVEQATGLGRAYLYQLIAEGSFPRPVKVGQRAVRWPASDVEHWIAARTVSGRAPAALSLDASPSPRA